jgi:hypothetical protein
MQRITILQYRFTLLSLFLLFSNVNLLSSLFLYIGNNNIAMAEQQQIQHLQQQTRQGAPLAIVPGLTGNILATVSFLIGTSSFILGLRIQSASRSTSPSSTPTTQSALSSSIINKYFDFLIFALAIPSIVINVYGILLIGSHLYPEDTPYLLLLFVLFIPMSVILFLVKKLHV